MARVSPTVESQEYRCSYMRERQFEPVGLIAGVSGALIGAGIGWMFTHHGPFEAWEASLPSGRSPGPPGSRVAPGSSKP